MTFRRVAAGTKLLNKCMFVFKSILETGQNFSGKKLNSTACLKIQRAAAQRGFFEDITHPSSSLYHLFPPPRDTSVLSRLRTATRFARPVSRTKNIAHLLITP